MTLRSPGFNVLRAMLWENWRLTRVEAAWKLALGIVGASAVLVVFAAVVPNFLEQPETMEGFGAFIALVLLVVLQSMGWFSINKLNVARPGFPFYLLYTLPVRTTVAVGVAMVYWTATSAALYLVSALLLRVASGYAFPLLPVAAWIAGMNLTSAAVNWSIRNLAVRTLGHLAIAAAWALAIILWAELGLGSDMKRPHQWPTVFDLPLTYYLLIGAIGLASFGLTVAAVARQRRGDGRAAISWKPGDGFPDRLVNLFRIPCPTSSATRAQVWFELKSRGLPMLAIGAALAIVNLLLGAVSGPIDAALFDGFRPYVPCRVDGCFYARPFAVFFAAFSVLTALALGGNAFGIRWRPGRRYVSAFDATQPDGTARLAGLKVLVRSVCQWATLIAVGASVWASQSFIVLGQGYASLFGDAVEPLDHWQRAIQGAAGALTGYEQLALAVVASIGVAVGVASRAALGALVTRYPRRVNIATALLLLYGLGFVLRAPAGQGGNGWEVLFMDALFGATPWIVAAVIVLATVYLFWRAFAERLMTLRSAGAVLLVSATFVAAWLTLLRAAGVPLAALPVTDAAWMLSPTLLPLMAGVLAPWSLSRIRHI